METQKEKKKEAQEERKHNTNNRKSLESMIDQRNQLWIVGQVRTVKRERKRERKTM